MRVFTLIFFLSTLITYSVSSYAVHYGSKICQTPGYTCYVVNRGDTWKKLFPDEDQRDLVMRINRMNTSLYKGLKIAIPDPTNMDLLFHAPFPKYIEAPGTKVIMISKNKLAFGAYSEDGTLLLWGPISPAKGYCPDIHRRCTTPEGTFSIQSKQGSGCYSSKYPVGRGGAPMPYCMFFHRGYALHGSYNVPGYPDSHGCIRLFVKDAQWLNQEFMSDDQHPRVIIY